MLQVCRASSISLSMTWEFVVSGTGVHSGQSSAPGAASVRFVKEETALLAPTNGGARLYINMEDYNSKTGKALCGVLIWQDLLVLSPRPSLLLWHT